MKAGIYFGFDFGTKHIGLAVGQSITQTARPLATLSARQGVPSWSLLETYLKKWQPVALVVGLATQLDGSSSLTSKQAQKFGDTLHQRFQLPIYYVEERLTTVAARERLREHYPHTYCKEKVDAMSAAIILESWFNS